MAYVNTEYRNGVSLLAYNEYVVLTKVSVRKHSCKCTYLLRRVRRAYGNEEGLDSSSPSF